MVMRVVLLPPEGHGEVEHLAAYEARGGYVGLRRALELGPQGILAELEEAGLTGRGGAGYPTARKWRQVREAFGQEACLVVNGAEGEPGSRKDRTLMALAPHAVVEGLLVAALATGAREAYLYVNEAFRQARRALEQALEEARRAGYWGEGGKVPLQVHLVAEPHVYLAGEETALLSVLAGGGAVPWHRPPYPAERGLGGRPTAVNNVETVAQAAAILRLGAPRWREERPMLYSLDGDVARPGVWERPEGTPLRHLVAAAGGMRDGQNLLALLPGGYSSPPVVGPHVLDLPMDEAHLRQEGSHLGCALIVVGDRTPLPQVVRQVLEFFALEACGRCPTCVRGTRGLADAVDPSRPMDPQRAQATAALARRLRHKGICAHLDTAAAFLLGALPALTEGVTQAASSP
jgi:NADH-quinone oxidoreductase subunit F